MPVLEARTQQKMQKKRSLPKPLMMWKPYHAHATGKYNFFATFSEICSEQHQKQDAFLIADFTLQTSQNDTMYFKDAEGDRAPQNC